MKLTSLTVIGTNHQKKMSRIWIEGAKLSLAGFKVGARYAREIHMHPTPAFIVLRLDPHCGNYKVSGKGDKPIIDTSGKVVREVFPPSGDDATKQVVEVVYEEGKITIQRPKEAS